MCTLEEGKGAGSSSYCMTDLKCQAKKIGELERDVMVVSCSSRSFKVWQVETRVEKGKEKLAIKNGMREARMSKLCSKVSYLSSEASANESEEDEEDDSDYSENAEAEVQQEKPDEEEESKKSSRCSVQRSITP